MKEELMKQLLPLLEKAKEGLLGAADMLQTQAPVLCEQILKWGIVWRAMFLLPIIILIILLIWGAKYCYSDDNMRGSDGASAILHIIGSLIALIFLIADVSSILKIIVAPKLYLIEYIAALVK